MTNGPVPPMKNSDKALGDLLREASFTLGLICGGNRPPTDDERALLLCALDRSMLLERLAGKLTDEVTRLARLT